jgi:G3E family GTPase
LPLCLVTGFLGSGKTSLLRHIVRRHANRRLAYLVNDFAAVDVDGRLLRDLGAQVISLPGGSIFCRCLTTTFLGTLRRLAASQRQEALEGVVIEASGMADPRAAGELLHEGGLEEAFRLAGVVTLVDPGSFHKLLRTLPVLRAQVEASDLLLVNKIDLHDEARLAATETALREIQPDAAIVRCSHGEAAVRLFEGAGQAMRVAAPLAGCRDPDYLSAVVRFARGRHLDEAAVVMLLERHADALLRVKGFLPTARGLLHLEWSVAGGVTLQAAPPRTRLGSLAIVARGAAGAELEALTGALEALAPYGSAAPRQGERSQTAD